ncbi:hypothetical protein OHB11_39655 [Streptomyces zaomyceticus]|uniref:hypothetical protein n=1 Tax=Streptomyces zaomyceticus TaxID=68286 RepID=UPI003255842E
MLERVALAAQWRRLPARPRRWVARRVDDRREEWKSEAREWHRLRQAAAAAAAARQPHDPTPRLRALRSMHDIAQEYPDRPTWSGDRLNATAVRLERDLGLDIAACWPYLWLLVSDGERTQLTTARDDLTRATALGGWALLYLPLLVWWWPALPLAAGIAVTARRRTRAASDAWARALEATCRLHLREAADRLGIDTTAAAPPTPSGRRSPVYWKDLRRPHPDSPPPSGDAMVRRRAGLRKGIAPEPRAPVGRRAHDDRERGTLFGRGGAPPRGRVRVDTHLKHSRGAFEAVPGPAGSVVTRLCARTRSPVYVTPEAVVMPSTPHRPHAATQAVPRRPAPGRRTVARRRP